MESMLLFLLFVFLVGNGIEGLSKCPKGWEEYENSCYLFVIPTVEDPPKSWKDARANCLSYGADLASINDTKEAGFLRSKTTRMGRNAFWIGLHKTSESKNSTDRATRMQGWVWSDGSAYPYRNWAWVEPSNYQQNEKCAEVYGNNGRWNDNNCNDRMLSICKRKKGLPDPVRPVITPPKTRNATVVCDFGWRPFRDSCYKIIRSYRSWQDAKNLCAQEGSYLVTIDDVEEQHFLALNVRFSYSNFWIGLNNLTVKGVTWAWESDKRQLNYTNWLTGEPSSVLHERCVEMMGGYQSGFWNNHNCRSRKSYICEKQERNRCPSNWVEFSNICYQFNLGDNQKKSWSAAKEACESVGHFSSLVTITSKQQQDFLTEQVSSSITLPVWIGLNDIVSENIFQWADQTALGDYSNWEGRNTLRGNAAWKDCAAMVQPFGFWALDECITQQPFICQRNKEFFTCNAPLGMENGKIMDDQITASSYRNFSTFPGKARLHGNSSWCPKSNSENEYLQVDLGNLYRIKRIAVQSLTTKFVIKYGTNGKGFKFYRTGEILTTTALGNVQFINNIKPFVARYIRLFPRETQNLCLRVEFIGCLSASTINDNTRLASWNRMKVGVGLDSPFLSIQVNQVYVPWIVARSLCLQRGADLVSFSSAEESQLGIRISRQLRSYSYWIGLNDLDYTSNYYWSDGSPLGYFAWGSSYPRDARDVYSCVQYRKYQKDWRDAQCRERRPFICMKREKDLSLKSYVDQSVTGAWIGSAAYYWPLSNVENGKVFGTKTGVAYGTVQKVTGVNGIANGALEFSGSGSYVNVALDGECLTNPDNCSGNGITLSFMANFDDTVSTWKEKVCIIDSAGNDAEKSNGVTVCIQDKKIYFSVSTVSQYIVQSIPVKSDKTWRHYAMVWQNGLVVYVNGKLASSDATVKTSDSKDLKKDLSIGIPPGLNIGSGKIRISHLAFWEYVLPKTDISAIYKTEFGWCPFGWVGFGKSCYQFNGNAMNWAAARLACTSRGGDLATISSPVEQAFMTQHTNVSSWIGLKETSASTFSWVNSEPLVYSNWRSRSRFAYKISQTCVVVRGQGFGTWQDHLCSLQAGFVCEKEKVVNAADKSDQQDISKPMFKRVCQFSRTKLFCPPRTYLRIISAFWGRRSPDICRKISINNCGLKNGAKTTKKLKDQCDGATVCDVYASSHANYFGNPCIGVYKYLEVNYTCDKEDFVGNPCPLNWKRSLDGNACYGLILSKKTWSDAQKTCQDTYKANLISIHGRFETAMATSLMERAWNTDVWIGLNDNNGDDQYQWSDNSPLTWSNWYVENPHNQDNKKNCVFMNLTRTRKDWMYWRNTDCNRTAAFMCKKMIGKRHETTTSSAALGNCSANWIPNGDSCYKTFSTRLTWVAARDFCMKFVRGQGNLASVINQTENDFITNHTDVGSLWIGLESRGIFRGHVWSDKSPVFFTNWDLGQPDSYDGSEACTQFHKDTGYWRDLPCDTKSAFICQRPKTPVRIDVKPPPTYKPSPACEPGWILYNTKCYFFSNDSTSSWQTWLDAESWCANNSAGGHLATVENDAKKQFLIQMTSKFNIFSLWIGLHDMNGESNYKWSDGTAYGQYVYWNNGEPNNQHGQEDCVSMVKLTGKWNDNHCSRTKPFICEAYNKTAKIPLIKIQKPIVAGDGYCAPGWLLNGAWCYRFFTDSTDYKSWYDAKTTCEKGSNSSDVGELVSIVDELEQAFVLLNIKGSERLLWIGMNNFHSPLKYVWADNSPSKYFHWANYHPTTLWRPRCVAISPFSQEAGRWRTVPCNVLYGYICKTRASSTITKEKTVLNPSIKGLVNCTAGYSVYDRSCYKLVKTPQTFQEAKKSCEKEGASLITVDSQFQQGFLVYLMERNLGTVWIGLARDSWSSFRSPDGIITYYSNWGTGQPNRAVDKTSCVQANVTGRDLGRWDDVDCGEKNNFICQINKGEPKITEAVDGLCPGGWRKYHKHCYKYFDISKSWPQARYICGNNHGELVSISDDKEMDFVLFSFFNVSKVWLWTGLNDRNEDKSYKWSDQSPVTFVNWRSGQPNDRSQAENCVLIDSRDGSWFDWRCNKEYPFICKRPLECSKPITLENSYIQKGASLPGLGPDKAIIRDEGPSDEAWCIPAGNPNAMKPRMEINLPSKYRITGITTRGRNDTSPEYVTSFLLEYSNDDQQWMKYSIEGVDKILFANTDGISVVTKALTEPIEAFNLAIIPQTWTGDRICLRVSLHGCTFTCQEKLGMSSKQIYDNAIKASSQKTDRKSYQARPMLAGWCAQNNVAKQWIQVNFGKFTKVTKIMTYGDGKESYVTSYKVQFSGDGSTWNFHRQNGVVRTFKGNLHAMYPMIHVINNAYQASYMRILPQSWNKNICMRFELFGCSTECNGPLIERKEGITSGVTLSSSDKDSRPEYARLHSGKAWCTKAEGQPYLEIGFETSVRLTRIASQGSPSNYGEPRRVTEFTLDLYINGKWKPLSLDEVSLSNPHHLLSLTIASGQLNYPRQLTTYDFPASNKDVIKVDKVRIRPKTFTKDGICMRVELYGCLSGKNNIKPTKTTKPGKYSAALLTTVRFTSLKWNDALNDPSSTQFSAMAKKIGNAIKEVYKNDKDSSGNNALQKITVESLREGSVVATTRLRFEPEFAQHNNITSPLAMAVKSGSVGGLAVDKDSLIITEEKPNTSAQNDKKRLSSGAVAGVVIAVLIIVILALGIGCYWKKKRNNFYGPKQFNNPILYSSANTDGDEFEMQL